MSLDENMAEQSVLPWFEALGCEGVSVALLGHVDDMLLFRQQLFSYRQQVGFE